MLTHATTLGRNGVQDFILVRASAIVLTCYTLFIVGFFLTTPDITFALWQSFWGAITTKIFTFIALVSFMMHAWIGLWQVLTDYVKPAGIRGLLQFSLNLTILAYIAVGFYVLWGV